MKLPRDISGEELAKLLERYGYQISRQTGSHIRLTSVIKVMEHHLTIPRHKTLKVGTLSDILSEIATYLEMYEKNPQRVIPFLCCIRWGLSLRDQAWLEYADRQLATGKFKGIGQLIVKRYQSHDPKDPNKDKLVEVPWDSMWAQDLMRLAAKHNVPLMFMMETPNPESYQALGRALQQNPNTRFIMNHQNQLKDRIGPTPEARAFSGDPRPVAALLEKYPNLFIDLSIGRDVVIRTASDRQIPQNWKNLYEKYNDRIIIGVDAQMKEGVERYYLSEVGWIRSWLSELSTDTAKKLAYQNIERILSLKP